MSDQPSVDTHGGQFGCPDPNWILTLADFYLETDMDMRRQKATFMAMTYHNVFLGVEPSAEFRRWLCWAFPAQLTPWFCGSERLREYS